MWPGCPAKPSICILGWQAEGSMWVELGSGLFHTPSGVSSFWPSCLASLGLSLIIWSVNPSALVGFGNQTEPCRPMAKG